MAIFGSARDISMFRKVNRELLGDVITQQVGFYKYILDKTKVNMYGEASGGKFFDGPTLLNSLIVKALRFVCGFFGNFVIFFIRHSFKKLLLTHQLIKLLSASMCK